MHYGLDRQAEIWIQELEEKLSRKLEAECRRLGSMMPYVPENGVYYDMGARELNAWTNGFFAGMMWQMYHATEKECFKESAEQIEERLDEALKEFVKLDHDVGFIWLHTAVANPSRTPTLMIKRDAFHTLLAKLRDASTRSQ